MLIIDYAPEACEPYAPLTSGHSESIGSKTDELKKITKSINAVDFSENNSEDVPRTQLGYKPPEKYPDKLPYNRMTQRPKHAKIKYLIEAPPCRRNSDHPTD